jgi:hypothetical protein
MTQHKYTKNHRKHPKKEGSQKRRYKIKGGNTENPEKKENTSIIGTMTDSLKDTADYLMGNQKDESAQDSANTTAEDSAAMDVSKETSAPAMDVSEESNSDQITKLTQENNEEIQRLTQENDSLKQENESLKQQMQQNDSKMSTLQTFVQSLQQLLNMDSGNMQQDDFETDDEDEQEEDETDDEAEGEGQQEGVETDDEDEQEGVVPAGSEEDIATDDEDDADAMDISKETPVPAGPSDATMEMNSSKEENQAV